MCGHVVARDRVPVRSFRLFSAFCGFPWFFLTIEHNVASNLHFWDCWTFSTFSYIFPPRSRLLNSLVMMWPRGPCGLDWAVHAACMHYWLCEAHCFFSVDILNVSHCKVTFWSFSLLVAWICKLFVAPKSHHNFPRSFCSHWARNHHGFHRSVACSFEDTLHQEGLLALSAPVLELLEVLFFKCSHSH